LDFDLDLGEPEPSSTPATVAENAMASDVAIDFQLDEPPAVSAEVSSQPAEAMALDISFDLDTPVSGPALDTPVEQITNEEPEVAAIDFSSDLELPLTVPASPVELSLDESAINQPPLAPAVMEVSADPLSAGLDFDFDLGEDKTPEITPDKEVSAPVLDLSAISLELDEPDSAPAPASPGVIGELQGDNPEAATKLELALAYEEMGDRDGARELLQEVLTEGSATQQALAQSRLDQIG